LEWYESASIMRIVLLFLLAAGLASGGCASSENSNTQAEQKHPEKNPEVGMTKEQVIAQYGKTDNISASSEGEVWSYHLNMGEAFIQFNYGYRPKILIVYFDKDGKVANWNYTK